MLTFNVSSSTNIITNLPCQIIPNSRTYLYKKQIDKFSGGSKDLVIHVSYPIRPFSTMALVSDSKIAIQLYNYKLLAAKLNAGYINIHLPASLSEFLNFKEGIELIYRSIYLEKFIKWNGIITLEIASFNIDLIKYLQNKCDKLKIEQSFENMSNIYYKETLLPIIDIYKNKFKICIDTAHLYANGCDNLKSYQFLINMLDKYLADIIHLNGNIRESFKSDEHIPFIAYNINNSLYKSFGEKDYNEMIISIFKRFRIIISENNFEKYNEKYSYDVYADWCDKNKVKIVPPPIVGNYILSD